MGDEYVQEGGRGLKRREVALKPMVVVEGAKGIEHDLGAVAGVSGLNRPQRHLSGGWCRGRVHLGCFMGARGESAIDPIAAAPAPQAG